jgi:DNA-binding NarL/FixJ family response regulator
MKLIIADDHELVRDALDVLLVHFSADSEVLHAADFPGALELVKANEDTDLVLMDVYMPGMEDLAGLAELHRRFPELPVVMMSGRISQEDVRRAFDLGARGFIPKTLKGKALISVLELVLNGVRFVPDIMLGAASPKAKPEFDLSPREIEVLDQLAKGLSNKVIARELEIEETTVKLHLRSLFKKLGVNNRTEAVIVAKDSGMQLG